MAEEEIIVTKFVGDLGDLDQTVVGYEKALGDAGKASDNLDKKTTALGGSVGALGGKFEALKESAKRNKKEIDLTGKSIDQLKSRLDLLTQKRGALIDPKAIAKTNADIAATRKQISTLEGSIKGAGTGAKGLFGSITQGASQAIPGIGGISAAFTGVTGVIGLAAGAVVGFIANFSRLDTVQKFFDTIGFALDGVQNRLTSFEGFKGLFDPATQAKDAALAAIQAELLDRIGEKQREVNLANAKGQKELAGLENKLRDRTRTEEERLKIADEITAIEEARGKREAELLTEKVVLTKLAIGTARSQGVAEEDLSDTLLDELAERQSAVELAEASRISSTEIVERRVNAITEQGANERAAIAAKAQAAAEKAAADEEKRLATIAQAEAGINSTLDQIAQERLLAAADEAGKEVLVTEKKYADLAAKTREGFEKIKAVTPPGEQAAIAQQEADALIAIEAAKDEELLRQEQARADAKAKIQEEAVERLRQTLLTETQAQQEAVLQQLDADLLLSEQTLATQEERDTFRVERTRQAQEEITGIVVAEAQKQLEAQQQLADAESALQQTKFDAAQTAGQLTQQIGKDNLAAQIAGLAVEKTAAVAQVVVTTQAGIAAAAAAAALIPPLIPPGIPNPAYPAAQAIMAATIARLRIGAGINIATILAQALTGAYEGEERVGSRGERPVFRGPRDRYLRKVHKNEGIVDADTNMAFLPEINTMRKGRKAYDDMIYRDHIAPAIAALGYNDMGTVNNFVASDTGQRIAQSVMLAKFYDANIVGELKRNEKQGRAQTELLAQMVRNTRPNRSRW